MKTQGKKGLGRGLEALLGEATIIENEEPKSREKIQGIEEIDINLIKPNENQPRKTFDMEKIDDLAASIREHGVIQPIIVRAKGEGFEIVAGERRWRASRAAGLKSIPCLVKVLTDREHMLFAIIENLQREDLNPIEEAEGFQNMLETYKLTQEEVSKSVGKSRPYITNQLRLLKLPGNIKEHIVTGAISMGHGRALIAVEDIAKQGEIANKIIRKGISVREVEKLVKEILIGKTPKAKEVTEKTPEVKLIERELKERFGTKVNLQQKGKKGKIEIEYYSKEELERLIEILMEI